MDLYETKPLDGVSAGSREIDKGPLRRPFSFAADGSTINLMAKMLRLVRPDDPITADDLPLMYDWRVKAWTNINRPGGSPFWNRTRWPGISPRELQRWDIEQERIGYARARLCAELEDASEARRSTIERRLERLKRVERATSARLRPKFEAIAEARRGTVELKPRKRR